MKTEDIRTVAIGPDVICSHSGTGLCSTCLDEIRYRETRRREAEKFGFLFDAPEKRQ